jgi:hypothetical protein
MKTQTKIKIQIFIKLFKYKHKDIIKYLNLLKSVRIILKSIVMFLLKMTENNKIINN